MMNKILTVLATIGAFFSAIFYVLFKMAKEERKAEEAEYEKEAALKREEQTEAMRKAENTVHKSIAKAEADNEELVKRITASNNISSFDASINLLRKQSESGNKRNTGASGARS